MKKISIFVTFVFILALNQRANAFETELWPGERTPSFHSKKDTLTLHEKPYKDSPSINYVTRRDAKIIFDKTRYRTIKPITIIVDAGTSIVARKFGSIDFISIKTYESGSSSDFNKIVFNEGESVEYLQYRAEGSCFFRWKQEVYEGSRCWFAAFSNDNTEWWIRVVKNKKPLGWLLIDNESVYDTR